MTSRREREVAVMAALETVFGHLLAAAEERKEPQEFFHEVPKAPPKVQPTVGRIVLYKLSDEDAARINRRRVRSDDLHARIADGRWPAGAQAHFGGDASPGVVLPLIITRVWPTTVNGQVMLDGNDQLWITSAAEGDGHGQWSWPPRV